MKPIARQVEILNTLAQLIHLSAKDEYKEAGCVFDYDYDYEDESSSVGGSFWYVDRCNNEKVSASLEDPDFETMDLIPELHLIMKEQTGGEWTSFTLILDENGEANSKFKY